MNAADQSTLASSIALMQSLSHLITSHARTLFTPTHPSGHTYDVVVVSKTRSERGDEYEARVLLHMGEANGAWRVLLVNASFCQSPVDALADLLEGVYECAGVAVGGLRAGDVYPRSAV